MASERAAAVAAAVWPYSFSPAALSAPETERSRFPMASSATEFRFVLSIRREKVSDLKKKAYRLVSLNVATRVQDPHTPPHTPPKNRWYAPSVSSTIATCGVGVFSPCTWPCVSLSRSTTLFVAAWLFMASASLLE